MNSIPVSRVTVTPPPEVSPVNKEFAVQANTTTRDTVTLGEKKDDLKLMSSRADLLKTEESKDSQVLDSFVSSITPGEPGKPGILNLKPFEKFKDPIMKPQDEGFDSRNIYNMATIREDGVTYMLYRGEDKSEQPGQCTGRIGLATSKDGVHFERPVKPLIVPEHDYEKRGIEDPRLVKVKDTYYLTYTAYDGNTARLCLATSKDMNNWQKHGPLFPEFSPSGNWTKSGAILPEKMKDGLFKDKYVMYFGDTNIWMAFSDDLIHWVPVATPVIKTRGDHFDSNLVEPGPPAFNTKDGIMLLYNSNGGDGGEHKNYNLGAVLFDKNDPMKIIARTEKPILSPTEEWEKHGYIDNVVFAEGMTVQDNKAYLYYGGADRYIGLAVMDPKK
ncbi:MAG: glycoside hydrolase family 130 protein [Chloroflexi bacterium]|nr:glycoside hydrolase family 130 protein [Chloroflexota bacterium]